MSGIWFGIESAKFIRNTQFKAFKSHEKFHQRNRFNKNIRLSAQLYSESWSTRRLLYILLRETLFTLWSLIAGRTVRWAGQELPPSGPEMVPVSTDNRQENYHHCKLWCCSYIAINLRRLLYLSHGSIGVVCIRSVGFSVYIITQSLRVWWFGRRDDSAILWIDVIAQ